MTNEPSEQVAVLTALARAMFPHDQVSDAVYQRAVERFEAERAGLFGELDLSVELAGLRAPLDPVAARQWLVVHQGSALFEALRKRVRFHLYDDHEVWALFGYPGASYDRGGYLHRGFDQLPWLPTPRVEEAAEALVEVGPLTYEVGSR